eukprot:608904-Hanusia_phi.AAC.1
MKLPTSPLSPSLRSARPGPGAGPAGRSLDSMITRARPGDRPARPGRTVLVLAESAVQWLSLSDSRARGQPAGSDRTGGGSPTVTRRHSATVIIAARRAGRITR